MESWLSQDLEGAMDWAENSDSIESEVRPYLLHDVATKVLWIDPKRAFQIARQVSLLADSSIGSQAMIIGRIAHSDLNLARELSPQVRSGDTKIQAYVAVGCVYVQNQDFEKAVDLGLQLDESAQADYYQYISYIWVNTDASKLYEILPKLPNEEARSKAAYALLVLNDNNDNFTEQRGEELDQYLTAKDREILGPLAPRSSP